MAFRLGGNSVGSTANDVPRTSNALVYRNSLINVLLIVYFVGELCTSMLSGTEEQRKAANKVQQLRL